MAKIDLSNAVKVPITCKRGNTFILDYLRFWQDAAKTVPLDITGYTFKMEVKVKEVGTVILTFSGSDFTISATNKLEITKDATDMLVDASPIGDPYEYDLVMTDLSSNVTTIIYGDFTIEDNVTNA